MTSRGFDHTARLWVLVLFLASAAAPASMSPAGGQDPRQLRVGHWVVIKGSWSDANLFLAETVELLDPVDDETLIGQVFSDGSSLSLMGQPLVISEKTEWRGLQPDELPGTQVKVEGHWRHDRRFDAREISRRGRPGRERIEGRIDALESGAQGVLLRIMRWHVRVPVGVELQLKRDLGSFGLAPLPLREQRGRLWDDEDDIPRGLRLGPSLSFGGQLEFNSTWKSEYDLDEDKRGNRWDRNGILRAEVVWEPSPDFHALARGRVGLQRRVEAGAPSSETRDGTLSELYGFWSDPFGIGLDLQLGRQDFDDAREWIYDENLDAVRAIWHGNGLKVEGSVSTVLSEGSARSRHLVNGMLMISNDDPDREWSAYVIDRRDREGPDDKPIHFGLRALGEWLPDQEVWADMSVLRGYEEAGDLESEAVDIGTTWSPESAAPYYFTAGFARGSGDDKPRDGVDESFRQTGLQDNNGRFGGVTSFRYYGEVLDPELSNLEILTLGVGRRFGAKTSLDLVAHRYRQVMPAPFLRNANLKAKPDGRHDDLGWGVDLVFGTRAVENWDFEVVVGTFQPGSAFESGEEAWLGSLQARFRF